MVNASERARRCCRVALRAQRGSEGVTRLHVRSYAVACSSSSCCRRRRCYARRSAYARSALPKSVIARHPLLLPHAEADG